MPVYSVSVVTRVFSPCCWIAVDFTKEVHCSVAVALNQRILYSSEIILHFSTTRLRHASLHLPQDLCGITEMYNNL